MWEKKFKSKIENATHKKNQFKASLVQNGQNRPKGTEMNQMEKREPKWTESDRSG